ncbi:MAG: hypothetical protein AB1467_06075 [Candidatus Diapherotrites archaeon]
MAKKPATELRHVGIGRLPRTKAVPSRGMAELGMEYWKTPLTVKIRRWPKTLEPEKFEKRKSETLGIKRAVTREMHIQGKIEKELMRNRQIIKKLLLDRRITSPKLYSNKEIRIKAANVLEKQIKSIGKIDDKYNKKMAEARDSIKKAIEALNKNMVGTARDYIKKAVIGLKERNINLIDMTRIEREREFLLRAKDLENARNANSQALNLIKYNVINQLQEKTVIPESLRKEYTKKIREAITKIRPQLRKEWIEEMSRIGEKEFREEQLLRHEKATRIYRHRTRGFYYPEYIQIRKNMWYILQAVNRGDIKAVFKYYAEVQKRLNAINEEIKNRLALPKNA